MLGGHHGQIGLTWFFWEGAILGWNWRPFSKDIWWTILGDKLQILTRTSWCQMQHEVGKSNALQLRCHVVCIACASIEHGFHRSDERPAMELGTNIFSLQKTQVCNSPFEIPLRPVQYLPRKIEWHNREALALQSKRNPRWIQGCGLVGRVEQSIY